MQSDVSLDVAQRRGGYAAIALNVLGALATQLYFSVINPLPTGQSPLGSIETPIFVGFGGLVLVALIVGMLWAKKRDTRIRTWYAQLQAGTSVDEVPQVVRRDVLNMPVQTAMITGTIWLAVATFSSIVSNWWGGLVGIAGVGCLIAIMQYFVQDLTWRPVIPVFFPEGHLSEVRAFRLPVLGRLLITFLVIGIYPPALLALVTWQRAQALLVVENPQVLLSNLQFLELFILGASILASVGLAIFVTRGITGPISKLQVAMKQVEQNNLTAHVPVTTNEELGYLEEHFNQMTAGLRQGELLRNLLNLYVSPEVARDALEHGVELGGSRVTCTVLFSDIRSFTSLSEQLPPEALIDLLNRYMTAMVEVIVKNGGIVNKFGGDSLLAVFGTPLNPADDHAACAARAALGMLQALEVFNTGQRQQQAPTLRIGVGLATGPVIAGNVGGHERLEYTVIGDTVNLASRLQDKTKEVDTNILLSQATYEHAIQSMMLHADQLPAITVKGKRDPLVVYAL